MRETERHRERRLSEMKMAWCNYTLPDLVGLPWVLMQLLIIIVSIGSVRGKAMTAAAADSTYPSTIWFNETSNPLGCDPSQNTAGYITTIFLRSEAFALGCLSFEDPSYYLTVALSSQNFPNVPVWAANPTRPVKDNATLSLDPASGNLTLRDVDGSPIWSPPASAGSPAGLRLTRFGNLLLLDTLGRTLWQSFDDPPLDVLLPGQSLATGSSLRSGFSSSASYSLQHTACTFTAVMAPGGLVLYVSPPYSSVPLLPYYALQYPMQPSTLLGAILDPAGPCNRTVLQVSSGDIRQIQLPPSALCRPPGVGDDGQSPRIPFGSPVSFVRLDTDGNLRGYHPDFKPSFDLFKNSTHGLCGIPNACGPYSVCRVDAGRPSCTCAGNGNSSPFMISPATPRFLLTNVICTALLPLNCTLGPQHQGFLDLQQVDFFANDFIPPTLFSPSLDACKAACASNCSCKAAFYRSDSQQCFLHQEVLSLIHVASPSTYMASIKIQLAASQSQGRQVVTKRSETKLIVAISVASAISILFLAVWHCQKGKDSLAHGPNTVLLKDDDILLSSLPNQPKRFTFRELRLATSDFSQKLGVGGFGSVYKGMFLDGSAVAIKQLENATKTIQGLREFRAEVIALSNINHQNLVHLKGFCAEGAHRLLVYEFVSNGSLDTWLFREGSDSLIQPLAWTTRLSIAIHTAKGLFFLHEQCRSSIIHLDIKPQNILLDQNFVAKISDFGLSRLIHEDNTTAITRMRGTPGYMAPECLILTDATAKSDVYSFGMVLLELVSGRKNVDVSRLVRFGDEEGWYFPALAAKRLKEGNFIDIVDKRLGQPSTEEMDEVKRVIYIAFWCIQDEPSLRPTMGNVLLMLEGYAPTPIPPLSFHFGMRFHRPNAATSMSSTSSHSSSPSSSSSSRPSGDTIKRLDEGNEPEHFQEQHHQEEQLHDKCLQQEPQRPLPLHMKPELHLSQNPLISDLHMVD